MMKKMIILGAMALIATTSCTKNESIEATQGKAISFKNSYVTKAAMTQAFTVIGYKTTTATPSFGTDTPYFVEDYTLAGAGANTYYYDGNAATNYNFYAFAPQTDASIVATPATTTGTETPTVVFTTPATANVDLLSAKANATGAQKDAVALKFKHALTKVRFSVKTDAPSLFVVTVESIALTVNNNVGTLDLTDGTIAASGTAATYTITEALTAGVDYANYGATSLLVVPQTLASGAKIEVTYKVDSGTAQTKTVDLTTVLASNKQINYQITLSLNDISFAPEEDPWDTETNE